MALQDAELLEKIRQQFETAPYPNMPLELSAKSDANLLYANSFVTPFYLRNQQLASPKDLAILDVGCGTGYKTLVLAEANPGAAIFGIDLSAKSIQLAQQRLRFHGFAEAQFQVLSLFDLEQLDQQFDYINCDEVLYLMPDLAQTLQILKTKLKPQGILRGNLHSLFQRYHYFRAQELFTALGLMQGNPGQQEIEIVLETMRGLSDDVPLKQQTWSAKQADQEPQDYVLMNYLFHGDQGYTIPDLFEALDQADLEFICMTNQRSWDLARLFQDPQNLPPFWQENLPKLSIQEQLQLFELIAPIHRLLDFWVGQAGQTPAWKPPASWTDKDWETARVRLHPQLQTPTVKAAITAAIRQQQQFDLTPYLTAASPDQVRVAISPYIAACLLPLWDAPQQFPALVKRILKIYACDPITLKPANPQRTSQELRNTLINLEKYLYLLITRLPQ